MRDRPAIAGERLEGRGVARGGLGGVRDRRERGWRLLGKRLDRSGHSLVPFHGRDAGQDAGCRRSDTERGERHDTQHGGQEDTRAPGSRA